MEGGEPDRYSGELTINERFVLQALCSLLEAVTDSHIASAPPIFRVCSIPRWTNTVLWSSRGVKGAESLRKHGLMPRGSPA